MCSPLLLVIDFYYYSNNYLFHIPSFSVKFYFSFFSTPFTVYSSCKHNKVFIIYLFLDLCSYWRKFLQLNAHYILMRLCINIAPKCEQQTNLRKRNLCCVKRPTNISIRKHFLLCFYGKYNSNMRGVIII